MKCTTPTNINATLQSVKPNMTNMLADTNFDGDICKRSICSRVQKVLTLTYQSRISGNVSRVTNMAFMFIEWEFKGGILNRSGRSPRDGHGERYLGRCRINWRHLDMRCLECDQHAKHTYKCDIIQHEHLELGGVKRGQHGFYARRRDIARSSNSFSGLAG